MFNSVCACQSTLKMQVALGACQPGTVTGWWRRCGTLGGAGNACSALIPLNSAFPWGSSAPGDVPGFSGLLWLLCASLVHLHLLLGLAPVLRLSQWEGEVCTQLRAEPCCAVPGAGLVCPAPGTDTSQSLSSAQHLPGQFPRRIQCKCSLKRDSNPFLQPSGEAEDGVKFINTKRVKRDFAGT